MTPVEESWQFGLVAERQKWARLILSHLFSIIPSPASLLDIGGGAGSWAAAAKELGVARVKVLDRCPAGEVVKSLTAEEHVNCDLESDIPDLGDFDLAISIEVAEHLTPSSGDRVVDSLVRSSKVILFSAAVPGQGGIGHINEQWHDYWHQRFLTRGYKCYDVLRPHLISRSDTPWFLRQNLFLYVSGVDGELVRSLEQMPAIAQDLEVVRKEHLMYLHHKRPGLREILAAFPAALLKAVRRRMTGESCGYLAAGDDTVAHEKTGHA